MSQPPFSAPNAPAKPHRNGALIGAAIAGTVLVIAGIGTAAALVLNSDGDNGAAPSSTTASRTTSITTPTTTEAAAPTVTAAQLDSLLLPASDVGTLSGLVGATLDGNKEAPSDHTDNVVDPACISVLYPAEESAYTGTGWTSIRVQDFDTTDRGFAYQSVATYADAEAAQSLIDKLLSIWNGCANTSVEEDASDGGTVTNVIGNVSRIDDSTIAIASDYGSVTCHHATGARQNVVIDTMVCRPGATTQGLDVLNAIADRLPS